MNIVGDLVISLSPLLLHTFIMLLFLYFFIFLYYVIDLLLEDLGALFNQDVRAYAEEQQDVLANEVE